jgi:hypothetical protein
MNAGERISDYIVEHVLSIGGFSRWTIHVMVSRTMLIFIFKKTLNKAALYGDATRLRDTWA